MDTIKVTELVADVARKVKMPELLVHFRLQEAAQRLGMTWGFKVDTVTAILITEEAATKCKWSL